MCSSLRPTAPSRVVFGSVSGIGTSSSSNAPTSHAALARCWLRSATASTSARGRPYWSARFSAVCAIDMLQCVSVSADQSKSSIGGGGPSLRPQRAPRTTCGAWLIDSAPPASTASASPSLMCCARLHDRLEAGAAEPVDRERGRLDRATGAEPDVAREVDRVGRGLHDVAEDDVTDVAGSEARPLDRAVPATTPRSEGLESLSDRRTRRTRCGLQTGRRP